MNAQQPDGQNVTRRSRSRRRVEQYQLAQMQKMRDMRNMHMHDPRLVVPHMHGPRLVVPQMHDPRLVVPQMYAPRPVVPQMHAPRPRAPRPVNPVQGNPLSELALRTATLTAADPAHTKILMVCLSALLLRICITVI